MESVVPWNVGVPIEAPCADISFSRLSWRELRVVMHFSLVKGGMPNDLEILLSDPVAMHWSEEAVHSVSVNWPKPVPAFSADPWKGWTYSLLQFPRSSWMTKFEGLPYVEGREHVAFVAMNDVIEVIAKPTASVHWITPQRVAKSVVPAA
jgi:hypothetical protein